jgi:hypothetical protein
VHGQRFCGSAIPFRVLKAIDIHHHPVQRPVGDIAEVPRCELLKQRLAPLSTAPDHKAALRTARRSPGCLFHPHPLLPNRATRWHNMSNLQKESL